MVDDAYRKGIQQKWAPQYEQDMHNFAGKLNSIACGMEETYGKKEREIRTTLDKLHAAVKEIDIAIKAFRDYQKKFL